MSRDPILSDSELALLRERGIDLGKEHAPQVASAVAEACTPGALRELQRLANAGAIAFYLLLGDVPGREEIALRLAAVNDVLDPSAKEPPKVQFRELVPAAFYSRARSLSGAFNLPTYQFGGEQTTVLEEFDVFEAALRSEAGNVGREDLLATVEYLASEAVATRCNALGLGTLMGSSGEGLATLLRSLRAYVCAAVVEDDVAGIERMRDMFALALRGLAPLEHDGSNWLVQRLTP